MKRFRLNSAGVLKVKNEERLLTLNDFELSEILATMPEGQVILVGDADKTFTVQAIVGRQNKGFAWIIFDDLTQVWSEDYLVDLLEEAVKKRQDLIEDPLTNGYRLFNGEGDGVGGITIDYYDGFIQINWYSKGAYCYRTWWLQALNVIGIQVKGIYETKRYSVGSDDSAIAHTWGIEAPKPLVISEAGRKYAIYLGESWMTGVFFDQREVRNFIQTQVHEGRVLNLFSYTGAFSIAASLGGAKRVVSVDVAKRTLEWTQENFELNGLDNKEDHHEIRIMDVFDYLDYASKQSFRFDWVICDPPSFARTKTSTFQALNDYPTLAKKLFALTKVGGLCVLSTNHSGYTKEQFTKDMNQIGQGKFQLIQSFGLPSDFPNSKDPQSAYLKVLVYYRAR